MMTVLVHKVLVLLLPYKFPEDLVKIKCEDALCLCGVLFLARAPVCVRMDTAAVVACQITEGFWLKPLSKKHA